MSIRRWLHRVVGNDTEVVVEDTGDAVGDAVTGLRGGLPRGARVVVRNTGDAVATDGSTAVSGIDYSEEKKR